MTIRTQTTHVVFRRDFMLPGMDTSHPAGRYALETDEELIDGVSFVAYRRIATRLRLDNDPYRPGYAEDLAVNPDQLEAALQQDIRKAQAP